MVNSYSYIQQSRTRETANANEMRFLIVLAMLATVALANPLISIRVNVDNPNGEGGLPPPPPPPGPGPNPDPEVPPPQPYTKQQLKRDVAATDGKVVFPVPTNDGNPAGTLVNIEVFVDNQRPGSGGPGLPEDLPPPQPY